MTRPYRERRVDRSRTVRAYLPGGDGGWIGRPTDRETTFTRRLEPRTRTWSWSLTPGAAGEVGPGDPPRIELDPGTLHRWSRALVPKGAPDGLRAVVTVEARRRHYNNSEGTVEERTTLWVDVLVGREGGDRTVNDGTPRLRAVPGILRNAAGMVRETSGGAGRPLRDVGVGHAADLLLAPTPAAVLFHELVGHAAEEAVAWKPGRVLGPPHLQVEAYLPRGDPVDAEGVPGARVVLVDGGRAAPAPLDRATALTRSSEPSGLSQAGTHRGVPRVRCSALEVEGGADDVEALRSAAPEVIHCTGVSGARYRNGTAVVDVSEARLLQRGRAGCRVTPFRFVVTLAELGERLTGVASTPRRARSGQCVKEGDPVPAPARVPTVLLADVPVRALHA